MKFPTVEPVDPRIVVADYGVAEETELDDVGDLLHVVKRPRLRRKCLLPDWFSGDEMFRTKAE